MRTETLSAALLQAYPMIPLYKIEDCAVKLVRLAERMSQSVDRARTDSAYQTDPYRLNTEIARGMAMARIATRSALGAEDIVFSVVEDNNPEYVLRLRLVRAADQQPITNVDDEHQGFSV